MKPNILNITAILLMFVVCFSSCNDAGGKEEQQEQGEQRYYYSGGNKTYVEEVPGQVVLGYDEEYLADLSQALHENDGIREMEQDDFNEIFILFTKENTDTWSFIGALRKLAGVKSVYPVYKLTDFISPVMYFTDEIGMKFKEDVTQEKIDEMHRQYGVEIVEVTDLWQIVSVLVDMDVFEIANAYQESGLMEYSQPNFISRKNMEP